MMGWLRTWLLSIMTVSLLCALAEALMPKGPVRRVGNLVCGLALLLGVLWPFTRFRPTLGGDWTQSWERGLVEKKIDMEERLNDDMKHIIEERCQAYIQDKGAQQGRAWTVRVTCRMEDGLFIPNQAWIPGDLPSAEREEISRLLDGDLGIPPERQFYGDGEEGK